MMTQQTYATIIADPDWQYANFGAAKHGAARAHYPGTQDDDIARIPVGEWARPDSILLLWATLPKLDVAIDVMRAWGWHLVTAVPWIKTSPKAGDIRRGIGFWFQSSSELLLVCRRGNARAPTQGRKTPKQLGLLVGEGDRSFWAPRGAHSRKPPSLVEWVESYLPGPYLELYARQNRPGWTCWGHDTGWHLSARGVEPAHQWESEPVSDHPPTIQQEPDTE